MIDVGRGLLLVAIVAAALGAGAGLAASARPCDTSVRRRLARGGALGLRASAISLVGATGVLAQRFAVGDHSLVVVVDHSRDALGTVDRIMGLWGGMAGSLLLFATATAVFAAIGAGRRPHPVATAAACVTVGVLALTGRAFADPFATLEIPALDGGGLTPILEHWAMRIHPPLVYAGLTATIVPAIRTFAALADRSLDAAWWQVTRAWLSVSWCLLGAGMLLGAHWAYVELGWGGYWAWDPIENAALLPWLAITVAVHVPARGRGASRAVLSVAPFLLALVGSTLTRSGATTSVHAFAEAQAIGRALAVLLAVAVGVTIVLVARYRRTPVEPRNPRPAPGELASTAVVATVLAVVFAGTLYPLARGWVGGDRLAVEGRFFSGTVAPVVLLGVFALVGQGRRPSGATLAAIAAMAGGLAVSGWRDPFPIALAAAALVAVVSAGRALARSRRGADLAHAGLALLLVGVAGTATGSHVTTTVAPGDTIDVGGHAVTLVGIGIEPGPTGTSTAVVADLVVDGADRRAELVSYPDRGVVLAETTLRSTPAADVQVVLRDADDDLALLVVNVAPLQQLVWWGGLLVVAGGALATAQHRRSISGDQSSPRSRRSRWDSSSEPSVVVGGSSDTGSAAGPEPATGPSPFGGPAGT